MTKDNGITIKNFHEGIATSPHVGFSKLQNLEIFEVPGIAKIKYRTVQKYSLDGLPVSIQKDINGNIYVLTSSGKVYKNGTLIITGLGASYDMKVWKNYLFITAQTQLHLYGPLDSLSAQSFSSWQSGLASGYNKPIIGGQDDILYVGNGNSVASVSNFAAAAAGVSPTGTWTADALTLPDGQFVRTLAELGRYLMVGTQGGSSEADISSVNVANIYPWDRSSTSFELPIELKEQGVNQMFAVNNLLFVHAGIYGNIYVTNGSSVQFLQKIPFNRAFATTLKPYPNAINYINSELLVGTSTGSDVYPNTSVHGIYSIKNQKLNFRTISTTNVGQNQILYIGAILPTGQDTILIGWQDGTSYGVDEVDFRAYEDFSAFLESPLYQVGTALSPRTFAHLEIRLSKPLIAEQQIRIKWRNSLDAEWTEIATLDTSNTEANELALYSPALISEATSIQLRVELTQPLNTSFGKNIELIEVRIT